MQPGNAYTIDVGPCRFSAGTCVAGVTGTNDTNFSFFQDQGALSRSRSEVISLHTACRWAWR